MALPSDPCCADCGRPRSAHCPFVTLEEKAAAQERPTRPESHPPPPFPLPFNADSTPPPGK